jgi:hypothetical protein
VSALPASMLRQPRADGPAKDGGDPPALVAANPRIDRRSRDPSCASDPSEGNSPGQKHEREAAPGESRIVGDSGGALEQSPIISAQTEIYGETSQFQGSTATKV